MSETTRIRISEGGGALNGSALRSNWLQTTKKGIEYHPPPPLSENEEEEGKKNVRIRHMSYPGTILHLIPYWIHYGSPAPQCVRYLGNGAPIREGTGLRAGFAPSVKSSPTTRALGWTFFLSWLGAGGPFPG